MRIAIEHTVVPASAAATFAYLADIDNLPAWATEFIQQFSRDGDAAVIDTPFAADARLWIVADRQTGVIDFHLTVDGATEVTPTRVTGLADGTALYAFTMVQSSELNNEAFEASRAALRREFDNVRQALRTAGT